jgi:hypothetical protein
METETFNYPELAQLLTKQVEFLKHIIEGKRADDAPQYYRVGYFGEGFPLDVRNKEFVYRLVNEHALYETSHLEL